VTRYNVAQVNIGRIRAELIEPVMAGFVNRLEEVNREVSRRLVTAMETIRAVLDR